MHLPAAAPKYQVVWYCALGRVSTGQEATNRKRIYKLSCLGVPQRCNVNGVVLRQTDEGGKGHLVETMLFGERYLQISNNSNYSTMQCDPLYSAGGKAHPYDALPEGWRQALLVNYPKVVRNARRRACNYVVVK